MSSTPTFADIATLALVAQHTDDAVIITDADGAIRWVNPSFTRITEYTLDEVQGCKPGRVLQGAATDPATVAHMAQCLARGEGFRTEVVNYSKSGREYWLDLSVQPVRGADGAITHFVAIERDVTQGLQRVHEALRGAGLGMWFWDRRTQRVSITPGFFEHLGYTRYQQDVAYPSSMNLHPDDAPGVRTWFAAAREGRLLSPEIEYRVSDARGDWRWLLTRGSIVTGTDGRAGAIYGTHIDISARKQAESEIRRLAQYDALTLLPNRAQLEEHLGRAIAQALRQGSRLAVLFLDLDDFKRVNDSLGHAVGDELLKAVSIRLSESLRSQDFVARLGGDEFVMVLSDLRDGDDAARIAQKLLAAMEAPVVLSEQRLTVGASLGIALFPEDGGSTGQLLKNADLALYRAKDEGRGRFRFFAAEMDIAVRAAHDIETRLRAALESDSLTLAFQPLCDSASGRVIGAEALLRWEDPVLGRVPPDRFVPVAERTRLILPLGDWVLQQACTEARRWEREGLGNLFIAVNASAVQVEDPGFPSRVLRILNETGLAPSRLELEITEGALMRDADQAERCIGALRRAGVRIAIDDFGTGYSSLSYLRRFQPDKLKIDRSFVRDLMQDAAAASITAAVIDVAKRLDIRVTAEGIETREQRRFLERAACDELQGYLLAAPMSAEQFRLALADTGETTASAPTPGT